MPTKTTESTAPKVEKPHRPRRVGVVVPPLATNFDKLPDSAGVPVAVFAVVASVGVSTIWARAKRDPGFPQPVRCGPKSTLFNVGDIRRLLKGGTK